MATRTKTEQETAVPAQETAEVKTTVPVQEPAQAAEETKKVVYVGPTLPRGKLKCNTILEGTETEIKNELKEILEEYPLVSKMLVSVSKLSEAKFKIRTPGNIMNKYFTDMQSVISGKLKQEV